MWRRRDSRGKGTRDDRHHDLQPSGVEQSVRHALTDELWGKNDLDAITRHMAPDLVNHAAIPEAQGASGMRALVTKLRAAFPDLTMTVRGVSSEGDVVVVRAVMDGTHTGDLAFKTPTPATNKRVRVDQVHTFRVEGERIVVCWMVMDHLDLFRQLGVGPGAPHSGSRRAPERRARPAV